MLATADEGFFTDHAQDQKFLLHKQASKLDFYRKENEQLKERINNLNENLRLNKQLLAMTEENSSVGRGAMEDRNANGQVDHGRENAILASNMAKMKTYQQREELMQKQIEELEKQREADQAQILIH